MLRQANLFLILFCLAGTQSVIAQAPSNAQADMQETKMDIARGNKYLFSSGPSMKGGEAYFHTSFLIVNQLSVGLSDYFSVSTGFSFLHHLDKSYFNMPFWVAPKMTIPIVNDRLHVGVASMSFSIFGDYTERDGLVYGYVTVGNDRNHFSLGLGRSYSFWNGWEAMPGISLNAAFQLWNRASLVTENYYFNDSIGFYQLTIFQPIGPLAINYGLYLFQYNSQQHDWLPIGIVGLTVPLHR